MKELYTQEILKNKQNHYEHITKRERDIIYYYKPYNTKP